MISSIQAQKYVNWELCLVNDASSVSYVQKIIKQVAKNDSRIKFTTNNTRTHIAQATNIAVDMARGDYLALVDHDDELDCLALQKVAKCLQSYPNIDMLYTDEDLIDEEGRHIPPNPKPAWSPDHFLSNMYTGHLGVYRRKLIDQIGRFRIGFEGSQDYDLVLRLTEKRILICHLPQVLYHWRCALNSVAFSYENKPYAFKAGQKALQEAISRRQESGCVELLAGYPGHYRILFTPPEVKVTIFFCGPADKEDIKSAYSICQSHKKIADFYFSIGLPNNDFIKNAMGDIFLFLHPKIRPLSADWLDQLAAQAVRKNTGVVSGLWLDQEGNVLHSGVYLGVEGLWRYSHYGFASDNPGFFGRLLDMTNYLAVGQECFAVQRQKFYQVNGFTENMDSSKGIDLCLKLYANEKFNFVVPWIKFLFISANKLNYLRYQAEDPFISRWQYLLEGDPFYHPALSKERIFENVKTDKDLLRPRFSWS